MNIYATIDAVQQSDHLTIKEQQNWILFRALLAPPSPFDGVSEVPKSGFNGIALNWLTKGIVLLKTKISS